MLGHEKWRAASTLSTSISRGEKKAVASLYGRENLEGGIVSSLSSCRAVAVGKVFGVCGSGFGSARIIGESGDRPGTSDLSIPLREGTESSVSEHRGKDGTGGTVFRSDVEGLAFYLSRKNRLV